MGSAQPRWRTLSEAAAVAVRRSTLRRTLPIALTVGTLLTAINLGGTILGDRATAAQVGACRLELPGSAPRLHVRIPLGHEILGLRDHLHRFVTERE